MLKKQDQDDDDDEWLNLTLGCREVVNDCNNNSTVPSSSTSSTSRPRSRRSNREVGGEAEAEAEEEERMDPPYPWATERPAVLRPLSDLVSLGHLSIEGEVACRRCGLRERVAHDLLARLDEVLRFIAARGDGMKDRAPDEWMSPRHPGCPGCGQANCVRPVVDERPERINWLFLFLGQSLGVCTLEQLKWHCKHMKNVRTGAKDRLLYLTYFAVCRQLKPDLFQQSSTPPRHQY